jgi:hypothetical protein
MEESFDADAEVANGTDVALPVAVAVLAIAGIAGKVFSCLF